MIKMIPFLLLTNPKITSNVQYKHDRDRRFNTSVELDFNSVTVTTSCSYSCGTECEFANILVKMINNDAQHKKDILTSTTSHCHPGHKALEHHPHPICDTFND